MGIAVLVPILSLGLSALFSWVNLTAIINPSVKTNLSAMSSVKVTTFSWVVLAVELIPKWLIL